MDTAPAKGKTVVLINPPGIKAIKSLGLHSPNPPIGLAYLAAVLKKNGYKYDVIDMAGEAIEQVVPYDKKPGCYIQGLTTDEAVRKIPDEADIVGISCMFSIIWPIAAELTRKIRERFPEIRIIGGGEHVTALPEFSLQNSELDAIVLGEGEIIFPSLIEAIRSSGSFTDSNGVAFKNKPDGRIIVNRREERIAEVTSIPWPDWSRIPIENYIEFDLQNGVNRGRSMPIVATRGCPFKCFFCSNENMWGGIYRAREPGDVVGEIESYMEKYGAVNFNFQDLTAFVNKKWVLSLSEIILKKGLKITWQLPSGTRTESFDEELAAAVYRAGCRNIAFAPESASPEILKSVNKNVNLEVMEKAIKAAVSNKINLSCFFVIGFPLETKDTLRTTLSYIRKLAKLGVADIGLAQFVPYPGSRMFKEFFSSGQIELNDDFLLSPLDFYLKTNRSYAKALSPEELYKWQIRMLINFYFLTALFHPFKTFGNIIKALVFRREETRYAKFITDVFYRRTRMILRTFSVRAGLREKGSWSG